VTSPRPRGRTSALVNVSAGFVAFGLVAIILRLVIPGSNSPIIWAYVGLTVIAAGVLLVGLLRDRRRATRHDPGDD
jgi:di/tricarboxylate transporter